MIIRALHDLIATHGPATASISGEIDGHNIVVDTVNVAAETVTIRDPWHGWRITVPFSALATRGLGNTFVQIARTPGR